jgi:ankyrin repeat protein
MADLCKSGIDQFNNKNYIDSLKSFNKILCSKISDKNKELIKKYILKCFKNIEFRQIKLTKLNINNNDHIFDVVKEGNLHYLELLIDNKLINWDFYDDNGFSPLHYSVFCGDTTITNMIIESGCDVNQLTQDGRTSLEVACCERDPNMISALLENGANARKHVYIREKLPNACLLTSNLDIVIIILKLIPDNNKWEKIKIPDNFPIKNIEYGYDTMTTRKVIQLIIYNLNHGILKDNNEVINNIINDELSNHDDFCELICPKNKLENILYSICPFINYEHKIDCEWMLNYEILNLANNIKNNLMKNNKDDFENLITKFKNELFVKIYKDYIETNLYPETFIKNIVLKWINYI